MQFVTIDLHSGSVRPLTHAPLAEWWEQLGNPKWLNDRRVVLPNTFIKTKGTPAFRRCATAVVDVVTGGAKCTGSTKHNAGIIQNRYGDLAIIIRQSLNDPPLLVAHVGALSRVIWDPNPQLHSVELTPVGIYKWTDTKGRLWRAGLYEPANFKRGRRYPLVIQTHGFLEREFIPSGLGPTGYAARALAAAGIVVLQVEEEQHCDFFTRVDVMGACMGDAYNTAATHLSSDGIVDAGRVGIMGFSATTDSVMAALTINAIHPKAVILNDGDTLGYLDRFLLEPHDEVAADYDGWIIGARPFGAGLVQWLKLAPNFNLDKVHAPVLIMGKFDPDYLLGWQWETYAGLRDLRKPVDLVILNTDQHNVSNPGVKLASEGGAVDWFRFWLQGYEDPNPHKAAQYKRWRKLEAMRKR